MKIPKPELVLLDSKMGRPLRVVADAAISSQGVLGGRLIPLVILDTSERPDVEECIRVHTFQGPGDVKVQWGQIEGKEETVILYLTFIRPSEVFLTIEFNIVGQAILVDQALRGRGLYIQAGRDGDRLKYDLQRPKILVEIGDTGFGTIWDAIFAKQYAKYFRAKGLGRSESRRAAASFIQELRSFSSFRKPDAASKDT